MYEKPVLTRLGKLREITKTIFALEPIPDGWVKELPEAEPPKPGQTGPDGLAEPLRTVRRAASPSGSAPPLERIRETA